MIKIITKFMTSNAAKKVDILATFYNYFDSKLLSDLYLLEFLVISATVLSMLEFIICQIRNKRLPVGINPFQFSVSQHFRDTRAEE